MKKASYQKFTLMMTVSFVIMYTVMFLNVDQLGHVMLSTTRTYMSLLMVAPMAISMMLFMSSMYESRKTNMAIIAGAVLLFIGCLYGLRRQVAISDIQYMKAMIPHHSSAIMVSQQANLKDPEIKQLSIDIIEAQKREIEQMKKILYRLEKSE